MKTTLRLALLLMVLFGLNSIHAQRLHSNPTNVVEMPLAMPENVTVTGCDTVAYGFPIPGQQVLYTSNGWGFVSGHNDYGDLAFAERLENLNGFTQVFGIRFAFGQGSAADSNSKVIARVWPEVSGKPGTAIYSQDLMIDSIIDANGVIVLKFPSPVTVSGPFYVGYEVTYTPGDTVAVFTTRDSTVYPSTAWSKFSDGSWYPFDDGSSWELAVSQAIYPIVLNGNFPVTVLPANPTITSGAQIQLNAAGGASYRWYPNQNLSCNQCSNPIASPLVTTTYTIVAWDSTQTCSVLQENTVTVTTVNVEDGLFGGNAVVYPNPGTGLVHLKFHLGDPRDLSISVVNTLGQTVYRKDLDAYRGQFDEIIDLQELEKGVYTLEATDGIQRFVQKIILQ